MKKGNSQIKIISNYLVGNPLGSIKQAIKGKTDFLKLLFDQHITY